MAVSLTHRRAERRDLEKIVALLRNDDLGRAREAASEVLDPRYLEAFRRIDADLNQYLMVVERAGEVAGTCHLTLMPSLTYTGSTRMQIEAVRVDERYRGQKIGEWMLRAALEYAGRHGATIVQLTTNKTRPRAEEFYKRLGFETSHKGMKLHLELKS